MIDLLQAVIIALVASAPGIYAVFAQRGKDRADVAEKYEQMAARAAEQMDTIRRNSREEIEQLEMRVDELEKQVETLQRREKQLTAGVKLLINQLEANDHKPVWKLESE